MFIHYSPQKNIPILMRRDVTRQDKWHEKNSNDNERLVSVDYRNIFVFTHANIFFTPMRMKNEAKIKEKKRKKKWTESHYFPLDPPLSFEEWRRSRVLVESRIAKRQSRSRFKSH